MAIAVVFVFVTMLLLLKKIDFIKYPKGQICPLRGHFCFLKISFVLDFFRETQDVTTVFLWKVGCINSFSMIGRIKILRKVGYNKAFAKRQVI